MLISILIPVYNVEKYLERCLESIEIQSFTDYEIILVDDGSTDSSGLICDIYQQKNPPKVRVIHQNNQGLLGARITAIRAAKGEYCLCLDSDDYWENNCLEHLKKIIDGHNPDIIIFNWSTLIDDTGCKSINPPILENDTVFIDNKSLIYEKLICTTELNSIWSKLILTKLMKASINEYYDMSYRIAGEDLVQSLYPITYAKKIVYTNSALYVYRIRNTSLAASTTEFNWIQRSNLPMRLFLRKYMNNWGYNDAAWIEKYHCENLNLMSEMFYITFRKAVDLRKAINAFKNLELNNFIEDEAYQFSHSNYFTITQQIKISLLLNKRTALLWAIIRFLA